MLYELPKQPYNCNNNNFIVPSIDYESSPIIIANDSDEIIHLINADDFTQNLIEDYWYDDIGVDDEKELFVIAFEKNQSIYDNDIEIEISFTSVYEMKFSEIKPDKVNLILKQSCKWR
jgi:hypothetical protein